MTNDSTELTFVRCPSCRSLVPAVSTRCRMCGSSLGVSGEGDGTEADSTESSRVRKNTTSTEGAAPVVDQVRQDLESAREALDSRRQLDEAEKEATLDEEDVELDDLDSDMDEDGFDDPLGEFIEEVDFDDDDEDEDFDELTEDEGEIEDEDTVPAMAPRPTVRVESGGGKRAGGLSFGGDKGLKRKDPESQKKDEPEARSDAPLANGLNGHDHKSELAPEKAIQKEEPVQAKAPVEKPQAKEAQEEPQRPTVRESKPARKSPAQNGRLCGWLVSYTTDPDGEAIELREGKFFVSGSKLKESDLVIEDKSISTPHAILSLDSGTFMIQDLMSDKGVFVKGRSEDQYRREEESFSVSHGDWVRFGDVEFLVTLVASVGS